MILLVHVLEIGFVLSMYRLGIGLCLLLRLKYLLVLLHGATDLANFHSVLWLTSKEYGCF